MDKRVKLMSATKGGTTSTEPTVAHPIGRRGKFNKSLDSRTVTRTARTDEDDVRLVIAESVLIERGGHDVSADGLKSAILQESWVLEDF